MTLRDDDRAPPTRSQRYAGFALPVFAAIAIYNAWLVWAPDIAPPTLLTAAQTLVLPALIFGMLWAMRGEESDEREGEIAQKSFRAGFLIFALGNGLLWAATRPGWLGEDWDAGILAFMIACLAFAGQNACVLVLSRRG